MSDGDDGSDMEIKGYEDDGLIPEQFTGINNLVPNVDILNGMDGHGSRHMHRDISPPTDGQPYLAIYEHPQQRGFRFRYQCEGTSHGGIQGERSSKHSKTYPSVKINNYQGKARVTVVLVTNDDKPKMHAHELIGKNCTEGICNVDSSGTNPIFSFPQLGIHHVKKKNVVSVLQDRILKQHEQSRKIMNQLGYNITDKDREEALKEAQETAKSMQLDVVCLQYTAYLLDENGLFSLRLPPVTSKPVYNSKSPGAGALKICRMDKHAGCCSGGDEVFLLCDKVQKDDISVRFFETDKRSGEAKWEAYGNFGPADVHRQYAIVFRTPEYHDKNIKDPIQVEVQLKRPTDGELSEPKPFTYYPREVDKEEVGRKRKKPILSFPGSSGLFPSNTFSGFNISPNLGGGSNQGPMDFSGGGQSGGGTQSNDGSNSQMSDHSQHIFGDAGLPPGIFDPPPPPYRQIQTGGSWQPAMQQMMGSQQYYQFPTNMYQQPAFPQQPQQSQATPQFMGGAGGMGMQGQGIGYQGQFIQVGDSALPNFVNQMNFMNQLGQMVGGDQDYNINFDLEQDCDSGTDSDASSDRLHIELDPNKPVAEQEKAEVKPRVAPIKIATLKPRLGSEVDSDEERSDSEAEQPNDLEHDLGVKVKQEELDEVDGEVFNHAQAPGLDVVDFSMQKMNLLDPDLECDVTLDSSPAERLASMKMAMRDIDNIKATRPEDILADLQTTVESKAAQIAGISRDVKAYNVEQPTANNTASRQTQTSPIPQDPAPTGAAQPTQQQPIRSPPQAQPAANQRPRLNGTGDLVNDIMKRTVEGLRNYAQTGDIAYLLFVQRHLLAQQDDNGDSSIHLAVINEQLAVLYSLVRVVASLNNPLPLNDYNHLRQTPLHLAVILDQPQMVAMLLYYGADPGLVDAHGNTPTHLACSKSHELCLQVLVNRPHRSEMEKRNFEGFTPLQIAVLNSAFNCVKILLRVAVDVNQTDGKSGRTALHHAIEANNAPITGTLILQGRADVNARTFDDNTPLHLACGRGHSEMARILIAAGADPYAENSDLMDDLENNSYDSDDSMSLDEVRGVTPIDLAGSNQKLLEILEGRAIQHQRAPPAQPVRASTPTSPPSNPDQVSKSLPSNLHQNKSDLSVRLAGDTRTRLCEVLDADDRWVRLVQKFHVECLMSVFRSRPSPTLALLHNLEAMDKSADQLEAALRDLKLTDALHILTESKTRPPVGVDSGLGSLPQP